MSGDRQAYTPNEPNGLVFEYWLAKDHPAKTEAAISDWSGSILAVAEGSAKAGMNRIVWDGRDGNGKTMPAEKYTITISAGGAKAVRPAQLLPTLPRSRP